MCRWCVWLLSNESGQTLFNSSLRLSSVCVSSVGAFVVDCDVECALVWLLKFSTIRRIKGYGLGNLKKNDNGAAKSTQEVNSKFEIENQLSGELTAKETDVVFFFFLLFVSCFLNKMLSRRVPFVGVVWRES